MFIVTGANGFIGSSLVKKINKEASEAAIVCVDSVAPPERPEPLKKAFYTKFIETSVLFSFFEEKPNIDCVFHMGACTDTTEQNKQFLYENNTLYTKQLYIWCQCNQVPFIYASSAAIYGDGKQGFNDVQDPTNYVALNPYGQSKLDFDQWILSQKDQQKWYGLRFFNVFGYSESHKGKMASLVYKAFHQINQINQIQLFKSHNPKYEHGKQMRDFVYIKDITRWLWELYKKPNVPSGIYNMGFGCARTWLDLANAVFTSMNKKLMIEWIDIPESIREQYQYFTEANMNKLQHAGLSKPEWSLERGVSDYINAHLKIDV